MARDFYSEISARIATQLEAGALPWVKPWSATAGANVPQNAVSGRPYSGCNVILLWIAMQSAAWTLPRFLTYKQAQEAGGNVRKGETGTKVYFVSQFVKKDKETDEDRRYGFMKEYTVFNVAQCDGLPESAVAFTPAKIRNKDQRDTLADLFIVATGARFREMDTDRACYIPALDIVQVPKFADFKNADNFYSTSFHELGHWTSHKTRCDRELGKRFGDNAYAAEELIAELTAAFLCAEFSMDGDIRHAGYIANWAKLLRDDSRAFFTAASAAQKAADFLRGAALASPIAEAA